MAKWTDLADWVGPTVNCGDGDQYPNESDDRMVEVRGVVLHIAEGTYPGTIAWQRNPDADVSSHFIKAKDARAGQMVDTDIAAWTQKAGNGHWISVENEGSVPDKLTASQVEFAAQILARAHKVYGVPMQVTSDPDGRGLGHHSMGSHPGYADDWGHSACPGSNIINQKPAIVARAKEIVEGDVAGIGIINLKKGDKGEDVQALQVILQGTGFLAEGSYAAGTYDAKTSAALLALRKSVGSSATSGDSVDAYAHHQVFFALAKQVAERYGKEGPAGPPGAPGEVQVGTVLKLDATNATVTAVTPPPTP